MTEAAQPALHLMDRTRIEQMAIAFRRDDLIEQLPIQVRRLAGVGATAIVLVHESGREREQQAGRERRRRIGPPCPHLDAAVPNVTQDFLQMR